MLLLLEMTVLENTCAAVVHCCTRYVSYDTKNKCLYFDCCSYWGACSHVSILNVVMLECYADAAVVGAVAVADAAVVVVVVGGEY